ncbi:hypothetical protein AS156_27720 [Bradyrhizobium macuxiense]|uniref:Uncharacterized protein n=1 Tax=Bradyrhizobium macuxiense TaxID=1755647 RepID=A0A109K4X8_9BRAD|nr:hypothetical protein AS156_27720 [Bradyrhizobium macuxiense]
MPIFIGRGAPTPPKTADETIFPAPRSQPETNLAQPPPYCTKGDWIMWDFINAFYREFCLARLQEMRKVEHIV